MMLSTDTVKPRDRLAYWVDMVCDTYVQLDCDAAGDDQQIDGQITSDSLATLELSRVSSTAQTVRRTAAKIARASEDYFLVSIQAYGNGRVLQDGRTAVLAPGDFALYDSTRPYELQFDAPFQQYVLKLPGQTLRTSLRDTHALTATTVRGDRGAGNLMIGMITSLAREVTTLAPRSAVAVADSVTHILVAGLSALPVGQARPVSNLTALYREQIKAQVCAQLRDPALNAVSIAAALRLSPSTVRRAWAGEPCALQDWIWSKRLDGARRDICDPAHGARGVSDIAFSWGFNDAAHFSRVFRNRFACSPRALRASQRST